MTWIENVMLGFVCGVLGGVVYHHVARWGIAKTVATVTRRGRMPDGPLAKRMRNRHGRCADCNAEEDEWCQPTCPALDPMDWR